VIPSDSLLLRILFALINDDDDDDDDDTYILVQTRLMTLSTPVLATVAAVNSLSEESTCLLLPYLVHPRSPVCSHQTYAHA